MKGTVAMLISRKTVIRLLCVICAAALAAWCFLAYSNKTVVDTASPWLYSSTESVPFKAVGVVPGTKPSGFYFANRIEMAAALYHAGKVKWLIVSGDNRRENYNEPLEMQKALVKKGVPASAIYCDYAGFTTLDTVLRARDVFGQSEVTIISQAFQNQRAIYLARQNRVQAIGINAADVGSEHRYWLGSLREYVARGRAVLDTSLLNRRPHFGGPKIIPGDVAVEGCVEGRG